MNQRLADIFEYADGKLLWKHSRGCIKAGQEAGTVAQIGRMYVQVDGKKELVHRVIWFLHHGNCPEFLDHIDGNPLNNKIENLRQATKQQNAMNRKIRSDNSTGIKGIYQKNNKFAASICISGVNKYLGTFNTKELAQAAYAQAAKLNFKEFARCQ
jgi:hypothetical protein